MGKEDKVKEDYSQEKNKLLHELIQDEAEQELFKKHYPKKSRAGKVRDNLKKGKLSDAMAELLDGTYCELSDGTVLSSAERLAQLTYAYTLANPTPKNVKTLQEIAGDNVMNVNVEGNVGVVERFLSEVSGNEEESDGDN